MLSVQNYIRKGPEIQASKLTSETNPTDLQEWLGGDAEVMLSPQGNFIIQSESKGSLIVSPGSFIAKDSNGLYFRMTAETLTAFYDLA